MKNTTKTTEQMAIPVKTTKSGSLRGQKLEPVDPGRVTMELLRRFEPQGHTGRRQFMAALTAMLGGAPILAHATGPIPYDLDETEGKKYPPQHSQKVMEPVNVHEIQAVSEKNLDLGTYEYITGGAEDEYTLLGNLEAYQRTRLRQHVAVDVSTIDTSLELLGQKLKYPIMLDPTTKNPVVPDGDKLAAIGARGAGAIYGVTAALSFIEDLYKSNQAPTWWVSQLGHASKEEAQDWARQYTEAGSTWLGVCVDHQYTPNRDRNIRNKFGEYEAGVLRPATPNTTWKYIDWLRGASKLPIIVKGILNGEDAETAVKNGADAIIVSNHGGRAYDGAVPTLMALPECVDAVGGKIPVLVDGGIRRGSDVLKALALGAKAVLVGRPPAWGVAAFGSIGVQRVMELLAAELTVAMGIAGTPNLAAIKRGMVRLPWEEYRW
jgi:isopentenyl diphosphate isomerase/L-lactate dehydrogenase-like FMN-dependent dehydrogenase